MKDFNSELEHRLDAIRGQNLFRELRRVDSLQTPRIQTNGQTLLNFSSNDYLGLANHPALKESVIKTVEKFGTGAGASRLICGSLAPFHQLEEALAGFKRTKAALTFSTGYATAIGTLCALLGKDDVIILDKLVHACLVDAAKLSGAKIRVFRHNDLNDLEAKLKWAKNNILHPTRVLVVTETIFSMDGDAAPLGEIVALKEKHGAWLLVDEAHATGIIGENGRGLADKLDLSGLIEIQMGTLGKALGASGGYICGSRPLIDLLVNRARSFIFSTAPIPAAAAAARAGVELVQSSEGEKRRSHLRSRIAAFQSQIPNSQAHISAAIVPLMIGDETRTVEVATALRERGLFLPAIRYPTVARGKARLRITFSASHSAEDVLQLASAVNEIGIHKS